MYGRMRAQQACVLEHAGSGLLILFEQHQHREANIWSTEDTFLIISVSLMPRSVCRYVGQL